MIALDYQGVHAKLYDMDIDGFTTHTPGQATLVNQEGAASRGAKEWPVQTSGCVMDIEEGRKACAYFFSMNSKSRWATVRTQTG